MEYAIKGFIETSFSDWPGKVVSVVFLPSCNFRCAYCQNHDLVLTPGKYPNYPLEEIKEKLRERKGWIDGVCLTGGEPTLHPWLSSLVREFRSDETISPPGSRLMIKLDTNGSQPEVLRSLLAEDLLDYVAMDIKGPLGVKCYSAITGIPLEERDLARIRESIETLRNGKIDYEFRITLVPTFIAEEAVYDLAGQVRGAKRLTLQNFNPRDPLDPNLKAIAPFDPQLLRRMQEKVNQIIKSTVHSPWSTGKGQKCKGPGA
ncbi:MAG: anaerobic ribonucleoside-triphosphate reductase activating protein [Deltaproteobacteria bacterium]|nr:anaerobic ribonucleoside-triphosphate reductase activating protein [Deltaproteobacteria bacterium]